MRHASPIVSNNEETFIISEKSIRLTCLQDKVRRYRGMRAAYPFTAPLVSPLMMYLCMKMNITITGMIVTTAKAVR